MRVGVTTDVIMSNHFEEVMDLIEAMDLVEAMDIKETVDLAEEKGEVNMEEEDRLSVGKLKHGYASFLLLVLFLITM